LKTKLVCALLLATMVLTSISLNSFTTPVSAVQQPEMTQFTGIAPGIWVYAGLTSPNVTTTSESTSNRLWTNALAPQAFVLQDQVYGVVTKCNDSYTINGNTYTYWVRLISDPDGSLNATHRHLSGDEVAVWSWFIFQNGTYSYTVNSQTYLWYRWNFNTGHWQPLTSADMSPLKAAITNANSTAGHDINARAYFANMWRLTTNVTSPRPPMISKYAYFTYWIDEAFRPTHMRDTTGYNFGASIARHRLLAFVAYNDTNHNNVLDFVVRRRATAPPVINSTEAMYVFKPINATGIQCYPPTIAVSAGEQEVNWGFKVIGLGGNMTSTHPNLFPSVQTEISSVEFDFHFTRNSTAAVVKVDEKVGQFNEPHTSTVNPQFLGLSLAIVYYSFFEGLQISNRTTTAADTHGNDMDNAGNTTTTNAVQFRSGGNAIATILIGGDTYVWNGTQTLDAYSDTMPWFSYQAYFSELGDSSVVTVSYDINKSVYAACFPSWSGYSIVHDPYFAVLTASTPSPGEVASSPILLIVAGAGIGILAVAVVLIVRRRRSA
jgi:hypothetical protein